MTYSRLAFMGLVFCVVCSTIVANGQTTAFTYQGKLSDSGAPANGSYDFTMVLWDAATNGTLIGSPLIRPNTQVVNGIFTVQLDFGAAAFNGSARYLEIQVKPSGNPAILPTLLSPRQLVTSTPYAIKSLGAVTADSLSVNCVNCITSSQIQNVQGSQVTGNISGSQINGAIPVASIPPGSSNYIQNTMSQQASSNFNISGTGKADTLDVTTQYNLGGARILSNVGTGNLFNGILAGNSNSSGFNNSFFGVSAGQANTTGSQNAFFGASAGQANTTGNSNAFFGPLAGQVNTTGKFNSFFGSAVGQANTTGGSNAFFGFEAGYSNTTGFNNSFFGALTGLFNTTGLYNSFFGYQTGYLNTTGQQNAFFGTFAGINNTTGSSNAFYGYQAGSSNTTGTNNTFIGENANVGAADTTGDNNTLLGANTHVDSGVSNGTAIGANALVNQSNSVAIGANAYVSQSNSIVLGSINGVNGATADTKVGIGTSAPTASLHVIAKSANATDNTAHFAAPNIGPNFSYIHFGATGDWLIRSAASTGTVILQDTGGSVGIGTTTPQAKLHVNGIIRVEGVIRAETLGSVGSLSLCYNSFKQIATCSSSRRYKTNIVDYPSGSSVLNRLRSVTFDWKESGMHDLGLVAEEVAEVEPLLVTHNNKGEIEGVKYDRLGVILLNAIKEQQTQIEVQERKTALLQEELERLKQIVCLDHPQTAICKSKGDTK